MKIKLLLSLTLALLAGDSLAQMLRKPQPLPESMSAESSLTADSEDEGGEESAAEEAHPERNPLGCHDVGHRYEMKLLKLAPDTSRDEMTLFFVYNKGSEPVHLYQQRSNDSSRTLFLNTVIPPKQWAVLSTSEKQMKYLCARDSGKSEYGKILDCQDAVKVCQFENVRYGLNNRGNFWIVRGTSRGGAVSSVVHYGIIPQ